MTPSKKDIQVRLLFLADDLDRTAKMMRDYRPPSQRMLTHAGELSGAANLCREWVEGMEGMEGEA
jgi:predicted TIM-barrel fold metal-dependent hydrolase